MSFIRWINENKEWLFSGVGIVFISFVISQRKRIKQLRFSRLIGKLFPRKRHVNNGIDNSCFISEKPADGTKCFVRESFDKEWTIRNCGQVTWRNRYMKCDPLPNHLTVNKEKIRMPIVYPGQEYTLKVSFIADFEGQYYSYWKMYDENNNLTFPQLQGLGVTIIATKREKNPH